MSEKKKYSYKYDRAFKRNQGFSRPEVPLVPDYSNFPKTFAEAKERGSTSYFTGEPCRNGHIDERAFPSGVCRACMKINTQAYRDNRPMTPERRKDLIVRASNSRGKSLGVPTGITVDDIEWPEYCPVFGTKLNYDVKKYRTNESPSLDRIKPELGYVKGNINVVSFKANRLRSDATEEDIERVLAYIKKLPK